MVIEPVASPRRQVVPRRCRPWRCIASVCSLAFISARWRGPPPAGECATVTEPWPRIVTGWLPSDCATRDRAALSPTCRCSRPQPSRISKPGVPKKPVAALAHRGDVARAGAEQDDRRRHGTMAIIRPPCGSSLWMKRSRLAAATSGIVRCRRSPPRRCPSAVTVAGATPEPAESGRRGHRRLACAPSRPRPRRTGM